jgi:SOS-response transcriptional repressor LexA
MGNAVAQVFTEAWHGLCTFHIMQNAMKHLHEEKNEETNEGKKKKGKLKNDEENEDTSILSDFSACMFEYEDIAEFDKKFDLLRKMVRKQTWLDSIY